MAGDRFEVLFVCHANMCRSPMAERLARKAFGSRAAVASAGTHAWYGSGMHPYTQQVLTERGADAGGFVTRQLTPAIVEHADLILAADREQRAACVTLVPVAARRTFTMRQFGRLAAGLPDRPAALPDLLDAVRGTLRQPVVPAEDDLPDPVSGPVEGFRACADEIERILAVITPS